MFNNKIESNVVPGSLADVTEFIVCFEKFKDIFVVGRSIWVSNRQGGN